MTSRSAGSDVATGSSAARPWASALALTIVLFGLGVASTISPVSTALCVCGAGGVFILAQRPAWALIVLALGQVVCPLYLAVPVVSFLPPFPASLLLLIVVAVLVLARTAAPPRRRVDRITVAFLAYGLALLVSVMFSRAPLATVNGVVRCIGVPLVAYAVTRRLVRSPRDALPVFDALLLGCVAISLYGMVEFALGWNPLIENLAEPTGEPGDLMYWSQQGSSGYIYRSFSVEMNPLYFGATVSMLFPYALARLGQARSGREKAVFGAAAALCILGVVTAFSRGPLIAIAIGAVGVAILIPSARRLVIGTFICGLAAVAALLPWLSSDIWERFSDPDNVTMRFKLWEIAGAMFFRHPLVGVGLNGFTFHQLDVLRAATIGPFPEHSVGELETIGTADGTIPQLAAEAGLPGLLAFAALFAIVAARVGTHVRSTDPAARLVAASAGIAACTYLVNGLTITIYTAYTPTIVLGILFALVASLDDAAAARSGLGP